LDLPIEAHRLKLIREELGFTQAAFAKQLGSGSSTVDIERGRVKLSAQVLLELFKQYNINPLWLYGESFQKYIGGNSGGVSPQMITVDNSGNENIVLVGIKAAAGYGENLGDQYYIGQLPAFTFPLPEYRNATFRGFQVSGDSMYPFLLPGEWVLAKAVDKLENVRSGQIYVVSEKDSLRVKKILKKPNCRHITLISLNPDYPPLDVKNEDILEMWSFHSKISTQTEPDADGFSMQSLLKTMKELKEMLKDK
jgi:SOS-response transcriptional repressor LexA